jgi:hypothetical protein
VGCKRGQGDLRVGLERETNSTVTSRLLLLLVLPVGCVWISEAEYAERVDAGADTGEDCTVKVWFADRDGDGYGAAGDTTESCLLPTGYVANDADCDDGDGAINPQTTWHLDADGDGFGDVATTAASCLQPAGYVTDSTDCDDTAAGTNPAAAEDCATVGDDDCDGLFEAVDALNCTIWFTDSDSDDIGTGDGVCQCTAPAGTVAVDGDCDDTDDAVFPGADEVCSDGIDNDCDGLPGSDCLLPASLAVGDDTAGVLWGVDQNDYTGLNLAVGADLVGDGLATVIISDSREDEDGRNDVGAAYLWRGAVSGGVSLESALRLTGTEVGGWFGHRSAAGDWDGDGAADLAVGAPRTDNGTVFLFFGPITASRLDSEADQSVSGALAGDLLGWALSSAGDVDGDGAADLLLGAYGSDVAATTAGAAYLLRGPLSGVSLDDGERLLGGDSGARAGIGISGGGDIDGDGLDDILVGADRQAKEAGAVYVLRGPVTAGDLSDADWILYGAVAGDNLGEVVIAAGDLDGDGRDDLLLGAPAAATAYLVSWSAGGEELISTAASAQIIGAEDSELGMALSVVGDVDGDGTADVAVGAPGAGSGGEAWLLYGPLSGSHTSGDVVLGDATAGSTLGYSLASPGDISGDAVPDLFIGAPNDNNTTQNAGAVWSLHGSGL